MDDGSRGRRMVRKELDVTSTHELLSHTLLGGCDRSSIAQTLGIWKSQLHQCETDFEYGNPTSLAATPSLAMQHTLLQDLLLPLLTLLLAGKQTVV